MGEIKEFKPSTKERLKPEKTAIVVPNEEFERRRKEMRPQEEKETDKSPAQTKGEARQSFIDKIKELRVKFKNLEENKDE